MSQNSVDQKFLAHLPAEITRWQGEGIITPEQGRAIIATYGEMELRVAGRKTYGRLITILAVLGSLLTGLGVILFFAANWDEIPRLVKVAMILTGLVIAYGAGYWLRYRRGYQRVGVAVIFLATLCYGAAIHLIAQVYNAPVNDPKLFLYWFLGVLPLAYLTRSQPITFLAVILFLGEIGFRLPDWLGDVYAGEAIAVAALYLMLGLAIYGVGRLHGRFALTNSISWGFQIAGMLTVFGAVYGLTFREVYNAFSDQGPGIEGDVAAGFWVTFYLGIAVAVVALAGTVAWRRQQQQNVGALLFEAGAVLVLLVATLLVVFAPSGEDVLYPIVFNVVLLLGIVGLVVIGYLEENEAFINIALVFFSIDVVTRYFEFSWTLFDRSFVFIGAGVLLLAGGFLLERARRKMIEQMQLEGANQ